jgi:uncharacterized RDD family membrane protein YckC
VPQGYAPVAGGYGYSYGPQWHYAGWWQRLGAWLLDVLIIGVPIGIVQSVLRNALPTHIVSCRVDGRLALCERPTAGSWAVLGFVALAGIAVQAVYFGKLEGETGQTIGKRVAGIRVVDANNAGPIGVGRAVGRYFGRWVSGFVCLLGYQWAAWDGRKQSWHDKMVSSVVVRA